MITGVEVRTALRGALRLAGRDPSGIEVFDISLRGFWNSFFAAVVAAPFYIIANMTRPADGGAAGSIHPVAALLTDSIAYVCLWVAFPLVMIHVARLLDRETRYIPYIVAANWCSTIPIALFAFIGLIGAGSAGTRGFADFLALVALLWALSFQWFVARVGLRIPGAAAAGIILLDFILSLLIAGVAETIKAPAG